MSPSVSSDSAFLAACNAVLAGMDAPGASPRAALACCRRSAACVSDNGISSRIGIVPFCAPAGQPSSLAGGRRVAVYACENAGGSPGVGGREGCQLMPQISISRRLNSQHRERLQPGIQRRGPGLRSLCAQSAMASSRLVAALARMRENLGGVMLIQHDRAHR